MMAFIKKNSLVLIYFFLIISTLLVFWQTQGFDFVNYDDNYYVFENDHVLQGLTGDSIIWALTSNYKGYWQPFTWLSLIINRQLFGEGAGGFHLVNMLLHLVNTLLLFAVVKKMTGSIWKSAFVAALFALHPMHVESVAWIAERKDVLSTLFLFLSLYHYVNYTQSGVFDIKNKRTKAGQKRLFFYVLALLFFLCGLLSKPMVVTMPFLLLLLDFWPLNRITQDSQSVSDKSKKPKNKAQNQNPFPISKLLIEKIPFFMLAIASGIITVLTQQKAAPITEADSLTLAEKLANAIVSYASYIGKLLWPTGLAANYPLNSATLASITWWQILLFSLLLGGITILSLALWKKRRYLLIGWLWFLGTLLPVIGLIQFTVSAYADRFTYIPYIGLFFIIAWGVPDILSKWPHKNRALAISSGIVILTLGMLSFQQTGVWKNDLTLFSHAVNVTENNDFAYNNLGTAYEQLGQYEDAAAAFRKALQINPEFNQAAYNLGNVYNKLGRFQAAISAYELAVKLQPDFANAYNNLGNAYMNAGAIKKAADSYSKAIELDPDFVTAYYNLGSAYLDLKANQEALDVYLKLDQILPNSEEVYLNMANAQFNLKQYDQAIASLKKALEINPDYMGAHINLGFYYLQAGDKESALEEYRILKSRGVQQADQLYELINQ